MLVTCEPEKVHPKIYNAASQIIEMEPPKTVERMQGLRDLADVATKQRVSEKLGAVS